jgi:hypothetical protein
MRGKLGVRGRTLVAAVAVAVALSAIGIVVVTVGSTPIGHVTGLISGVNFPEDLAFDSANGDLYPAMGFTNYISVASTATSTVTAQIQVEPTAPPPSPPSDGLSNAVAFDNASGYVFVSTPPNITVIDGATNSVVRTLPIRAVALAVDGRNGDVYAEGSNISVISSTGSRVIASFPDFYEGAGTSVIAFDSRNGDVYVGGGAGVLGVFNGSSNSFAGNLTLWSTPGGLCVDTGNGNLYLPSSTGDFVSVIDPNSGAVLSNISVPEPNSVFPHEIVYDPADGDLYLGTGGNGPGGNVTVIDGSTNRVLGAIPATGYLSALVLDPENGNIYAASLSRAGVWIISPADVFDGVPVAWGYLLFGAVVPVAAGLATFGIVSLAVRGRGRMRSRARGRQRALEESLRTNQPPAPSGPR